MNRRVARCGMIVVGVVGAVSCCLAGCNGPATGLPAELVVWGDPQSDAETFIVLDANEDAANRFIVVGTGGEVQFSGAILKVCTDCTVDGATILIADEPRMYIRWGLGPDGDGERFPFLVSTDGFYIEMVQDGSRIRFEEEDVRFEEVDDLTDDLAVPVGTIANPALE